MTNIVYVHAHVSQAKNPRLISLSTKIERPKIEGLLLVEPVLVQSTLDRLSSGIGNALFKQHLPKAPFGGLGIWTQWQSGVHIDRFYRSALHQEFSQEGMRMLSSGERLEVVQYKNGQVYRREIRAGSNTTK